MYKRCHIIYPSHFVAEYACQCGPDALTHEALVAEVRSKGRAQVPDHLKAELLGMIKATLSR